MGYKLLDLFCKAGGCTKGYQQAGFYVVGVDIEHQPRYCGDDFILGDALVILDCLLKGEKIQGKGGQWYSLDDFDAIHASPPCQKYSESAKQWRSAGKEYPDLIAPIRKLLQKIGKPYIIENVKGSPLIDPTILNGAMFGLLINRERWFECNPKLPFFLIPPNGKPVKMGRPVKDGDIIQPVGHFSNVPYARRQMGIDWMTQAELAQAIPPAYTEYIGKRILELLPAPATIETS
jgi:DNA (cytosine-5)-methyltransferase 1